MKEHQIRTAIKAYLDAGGDPEFYILSKEQFEKNWRKQVRRELKLLYRVAIRAATHSTHDTLPVMIAMERYIKSKGVEI